MKKEKEIPQILPGERTQEPRSVDRRSLLGYLTGAIAAGVTSVLGVTIGRYTIEPAFWPAATSEWSNAGLLEEIPDNKPVKRSLVVSQQAGWGRVNSQKLVWIVRKNGDLTVFSAVCPHLGCTINEAVNGFICPCHGSAWNSQGQKIGGPAPRNLDVLEHRTNGAILEIKYQTFKQGLANQEVVG